jgi:hypothetical protein
MRTCFQKVHSISNCAAKAWAAAVLATASTSASASASAAPAKLRFSAVFALSIASLRIAALSDSHAAVHPVSVRLLWSQVKGNLNKRLASSTSIRFDTKNNKTETPSDLDAWVFSCGHQCSAAYMVGQCRLNR